MKRSTEYPSARRWALILLCLGQLASASAQSIFTCTDNRGKRVTSDRPIPECMDREQKELNPSGSVKRYMGPVLTPQEEAAKEQRERKEAEERARGNEEIRRNRALVARYQNKPAHDASRAEALTQVDAVIRVARNRLAELAQQRTLLDGELEFYKQNPSKAPAALQRRVAEHDENVVAQKRFIANQELEKQRINDRFDEELGRLKLLWSGAH